MRRTLWRSAVISSALVLGCTSELVVSEDGDSDLEQEIRVRTLHTSVNAGDVATVQFQDGSGAPYPGSADVGQTVSALGCAPAASQLTGSSQPRLSLGWAGGILDRGAILRENYASLAGEATIHSTVKVCDATGPLARIRWWSEIRGNAGQFMKATLTAPDGQVIDKTGDIRRCIGDSCSILDVDVQATLSGTWKLVLQNTSKSDAKIATFMHYAN